MKTILWKELREHARWTPLGAIPMLVVLVLEWRSNELIFDEEQGLSALVGLVASIVSVCLGVLQSWPDERPAARALLMHRGITADAAFAGKLLAGLVMYAAAVFGPLLGMAVFLATVGVEQRACWSGALLPSVLISVAAFSLWPATVLVVQRDAWFMGSRLLPALTAALGVLGCGASMYEVLWPTLVLMALTFIVFLVAARNVFVTSDRVATGSGRSCVALSVTLGLLTVTLVTAALVESYRGRVDAGQVYNDYFVYQVALGPDGKAWLTRTKYYTAAYDPSHHQGARLVAGSSVRDDLKPLGDGWEALRTWTPASRMYYSRRTQFGGRFVTIANAQVPNGAVNVQRTWIFDDRRDALLVYRQGAGGQFQLETTLLAPAKVGSFGELRSWGSGDNDGNFTLLTSTGVHQLSGSGSNVETVYALPTTSKLLGWEVASRMRPSGDLAAVMLRLRDRLILIESQLDDDAASRATSLGTFDVSGEVFATEILLPSQMEAVEGVMIAKDPAGDGTFVGLAFDSAYSNDQLSWLRFDANGEVEQHVRYTESTAHVPVVVRDGREILALIPPGVYVAGAVMIALDGNGFAGAEKSWREAREKPAKTAALVFLGTLQPIIGMLLAVWAARRRKLGWRATWWWVGWAFFAGVYGSLALLAVYRRVVSAPCEACHKPTRIDLARCEHCDGSLDEMPAIGIEIFDRHPSRAADASQPASV